MILTKFVAFQQQHFQPLTGDCWNLLEFNESISARLATFPSKCISCGINWLLLLVLLTLLLLSVKVVELIIVALFGKVLDAAATIALVVLL